MVVCIVVEYLAFCPGCLPHCTCQMIIIMIIIKSWRKGVVESPLQVSEIGARSNGSLESCLRSLNWTLRTIVIGALCAVTQA